MNEKAQHQSGLKYRSDIDGLRAVAVLSVLGCHIGLPRMAGGFVGVDVFFVISGYLISSIIFAEIAASCFSIRSFYERRIRRIFPALFVMLLAFMCAATVYFLPIELVAYCKSLLAATTSLSNFYFWRHSGYFDSPTSNPLLHTWSLAVEEQFYILFPIFLILTRKLFPNRLRAAVFALFISSLILSEIVVRLDRNTAFYMPYTRAWELLLGTLLSLKVFGAIRAVWFRQAVTAVGAAMIGFSVLSYTPGTRFPGLSALVPAIGSGLIIWAGEFGTSFIGFLLSTRPVVFVGLISYSLYLWHWPIIILHTMGILLPVGTTLRHHAASLLTARHYSLLVETALSFVIATLSWRFVERPFRRGSLRLRGAPLFALAGTTMAMFVAFASFSILVGGFESRFPIQSVHLASYLEDKESRVPTRVGVCFITTAGRFSDYESDVCLHHEEGKENYLLLGDSHSAMLWMALASALPNTNIMQASTSGCMPFVHPVGSTDCKKMMSYIFDEYLPTHSVKSLLIEARWSSKDVEGLDNTLSWTSQHHVPVVLFGPVPEYDAPLPRLEAYSIAWREPELVSQHRVRSIETIDQELRNVATARHIPYVSLYRAICSQADCLEYSDVGRTVPLMFDSNHLSPAASLLVVQHLIDGGLLSLGEAANTK